MFKFSYEIDSSFDWEEILDTLKEYFNLEKGIMEYSTSEEPHNHKKELSIEEIKEMARDMIFQNSSFSITFDNFQINVIEFEDRIEISSDLYLQAILESRGIELS